MAATIFYFACFLSIILPLSVKSLPEPGKKTLKFGDTNEYGLFTKAMNKGATVAVKGQCEGYKGVVIIDWILKMSPCAEHFTALPAEDYQYVWDNQMSFELRGHNEVDCTKQLRLKDETDQEGYTYIPPPTTASSTVATKTKKKGDDTVKENTGEGEEQQHEEEEATDDGKQDDTGDGKSRRRRGSPQSKQVPVDQEKYLVRVKRKGNAMELSEELIRVKRTDVKQEEDPEESTGLKKSKKPTEQTVLKKQTEPTEPTETEKPKQQEKNPDEAEDKSGAEKSASSDKTEKVDNQICATKYDGVYLLMIKAVRKDKEDKPTEESKKQKKAKSEDKEEKFQLILNVEMKDKHGYLSASDWPLYPFYGVMSLLYVFYGVVWLVVSACQWRDLLRIQFWIGGVIALGMLEKAVFFSEYNSINISGDTNPSLTIFAELVSCVKRTLARILVIIVSMGFGIVKPRLGTALHRVLGVGALYFILATIEGCFRALRPKADPGRQQLIASIPLAVLDASICWWIFMSLVQTTRTLRIRRNLIKLSLYRHFTNTLIFAVLASVAYMIWSIKTHRFAKDGCITDWSELWLDEAFWHFLFSLVLLVIMVLWRPTANNQRYAFTPLVDFGDDDDDDNMTLSDAFDGMKMRNVKNTPEVIINGDMKRKFKPEDDLKWVEENIPTSAADAVLPSVLDSDEELMTTKFEMSKME